MLIFYFVTLDVVVTPLRSLTPHLFSTTPLFRFFLIFLILLILFPFTDSPPPKHDALNDQQKKGDSFSFPSFNEKSVLLLMILFHAHVHSSHQKPSHTLTTCRFIEMPYVAKNKTHTK